MNDGVLLAATTDASLRAWVLFVGDDGITAGPAEVPHDGFITSLAFARNGERIALLLGSRRDAYVAEVRRRGPPR